MFSFKINARTLTLFGAVKLKTKQKVCVWSLGTTVDGKVERDRFHRAHDAFYWFTFNLFDKSSGRNRFFFILIFWDVILVKIWAYNWKFGARDWVEERHKMAAENLKRMSIFSGISAILAPKRQRKNNERNSFVRWGSSKWNESQFSITRHGAGNKTTDEMVKNDRFPFAQL